MTSQRPQHARPRRRRIILPEWATYLLLALFVIAIVAVAYLTFNGVKRLVAGAPWGGGEGIGPELNQEDVQAQAGGQGEESAIWSEGRVTILLLGIDERQLESGPWRTDTMILLTVDPDTRTAGMLSIPRDLWVEIPGYGVYDRINTAHFRGDADRYPGGGGPALAMQTVQYNLGVPVNYYVSVNFYAFVKIIDHIGCIPITVPETIDDPTFPAPEGYGYAPFYLEAGDYCLGGETLLQYARTRATFGGDFDRAARQQQVIRAIRDHVLSTGQLPTLIAQAPEIYAEVQQGISTNLSLQQMIQLAWLAAEIPDENICSAVINGQYVNPATLADGSQVLVPDWVKVRQLVLDVYNGTGVCDPDVRAQQEDLAAGVASERAAVRIVNGTQQEGLATETANRLEALGINVIDVGNADRFDYEQTIIYDYTGKTSTARYIAQALGVPETAIIAAESPSGLYDIEVILGADYRP
ncbi:MAG TPA: LytR family transcriptional regulator [Chloroflexi bacterium]|nr:LytR family transcriptional regulator [Chloroflexota bacterium]